MIIFPAIDLRGGNCVRLYKGDFKQETIFSDKPWEMALKWQEAGAQYLHLVDLDGALAGKPVNTEVIRKIVSTLQIPVQLGGGLRNEASLEAAFELGITRVILGSIAVKKPEFVKEAIKKYGGEKIVVGIDAKDGIVAVEGWGISGQMKAVDLAKAMAEVGVKHIVYTDISRDGTLEGVNVAATAALAKETGLSVIASGGVKDLADIRALMPYEQQGVEGVITGKALYTGSLNLADALALVKG